MDEDVSSRIPSQNARRASRSCQGVIERGLWKEFCNVPLHNFPSMCSKGLGLGVAVEAASVKYPNCLGFSVQRCLCELPHYCPGRDVQGRWDTTLDLPNCGESISSMWWSTASLVNALIITPPLQNWATVCTYWAWSTYFVSYSLKSYDHCINRMYSSVMIIAFQLLYSAILLWQDVI